MSDTGTPALIVGAVALLGSLGALFKIIKKSDCFGIHIETRTPPETPHIQLTAPPPSPINTHKNDKNNNDNNIREIEV